MFSGALIAVHATSSLQNHLLCTFKAKVSKMRLIYACLWLMCCFVSRGTGESGLTVANQWKYIDWLNVVETQKPFILGNAFPMDVDIDKRGRIFVTTPQWLDGVPVTLSLVTNAVGPGGPLLTPYPDWTWHDSNSCENLISVFRMAIDECNRLWIVDLGRRGTEVLCPTKLMVFDLKTDRLIHKYILPADQSLNSEASLVTPIVEIGDTCDDAFLYVADVGKHGLFIYDYRNRRSWRLKNGPGNAFGYDPEARNVTIAGEDIELDDGILGMALSPPGFFKHRYLYFNSLASFYQKFSPTDSLKRSQYEEPAIFQSLYKRQSQAGAQAMSRNGVLFFQLAELTALACWNIEKPFVPENIAILAQDGEALQYTSGIKVIINKYGEEELWFITNRLQKIINKTIKLNEINWRMIQGPVDDLIRNTVCEPKCTTGPYPDYSTWEQIHNYNFRQRIFKIFY